MPNTHTRIDALEDKKMMNPLHRLSLAAAAAALLLPQQAGAEPLSPVEEKIVAAVKARSPEALKLLERSVNVNSGTMNFEGVREVGRIFGAEFEQLGFAVRWSGMPPAMQRAGHLVATHAGTQGKRVLLIGHLDTVFEKTSAVQLWNRQGERVRGQGVNDMKGGDVIIIEALRALKAAGVLDPARITVVFSGDEERAGDPIEVSRADMVKAAKDSDVALAFEGTVRDKSGLDTATIGRRASASWSIKISGKQGHSAGVFSESSGYGAIYEAARILNTFREQLIEPDLTFNAAMVLGGTELSFDNLQQTGTISGKTNIIPKVALVKGDMRYLSVEQRDKALAKMRAIVAQSLPGTHAEFSFNESYPPMAPTAGNLAVLALYSKASADAGLGAITALPPGQRGAGDVQFVAPYVDSLDGLGATGNGAHSPEEDLELASIERAAIRTAVLLYRLTR